MRVLPLAFQLCCSYGGDMTKAEIEIGGVYTAKVSAKVVPVQILSHHPVKGWMAINLTTKREIHIRTAARLRKGV